MNRINICICVACIFLASCATAGNERIKAENQTTIASKLTEGKTTKQEVEANLGSASSVSFTDSGNEIWTYKHARATPNATSFIPIVSIFTRGAEVKTKELIILFDKNGVVTKYTMRETVEEVKQGIAH